MQKWGVRLNLNLYRYYFIISYILQEFVFNMSLWYKLANPCDYVSLKQVWDTLWYTYWHFFVSQNAARYLITCVAIIFSLVLPSRIKKHPSLQPVQAPPETSRNFQVAFQCLQQAPANSTNLQLFERSTFDWKFWCTFITKDTHYIRKCE